MSQNKEAENLDDIFLIKDKNKPRTNKERSREEKARETKQIVNNLKKMQDPGKRWNEEQKNEVHYERDGTKNRRMKFTMKEMDSLDLKALLNKSQEKLKEEKAIKCLWKI